MTRKFLFAMPMAALLAVLPLAAAAQEVPVLIRNAHILTMGGKGEIANGSVLIKSGRIVAAGDKVDAPADARIIDAEGAIVTPGFMLIGNAAGAIEFPFAPGYDDSQSSGDTTAGFDVQYAINPDSAYLPEIRREGSSLALVAPNQAMGSKRPFGYFGGLAAVLRLGASPSVAKAHVAVTLAMGSEGAAAAGGSRASQIMQLRRLFAQLKSSPDGKLAVPGLAAEDVEALKAVAAKQTPLLISVNRKGDILAALSLAREYDLRIILDGAVEAWLVAAEIARAGVPVVATASSGTPGGPDGWGQSRKNLAHLAAAGVKVAVKLDEGGAIFNHPTSRYVAGIAVAEGLPREKALQALTSVPAQIFGLEADYGSIEPGKAADLILWNGDPLEPATGIRTVFIGGAEQSLVSRKSLLRDRYLAAPVTE